MKSLRIKTTKSKNAKRSRTLPRVARAKSPAGFTEGAAASDATRKFTGTFDEMAKFVDRIRAEQTVAASSKRVGPPYVLTEAERTDILLKHGFHVGDVEFAVSTCKSGIHEIEDEIRDVAEAIFNGSPEYAMPSRDAARHYSVAMQSHARSLCEIATRLMRYAGRIEGYADSVERSDKGEETVKAFERGEMGRPPFLLSEIRAAAALRGEVLKVDVLEATRHNEDVSKSRGASQ